jgi:hypothetical protein
MFTLYVGTDDPQEAAELFEFVVNLKKMGKVTPTNSSASASQTTGAGGGSASASADEGWPDDSSAATGDDPWGDGPSTPANAGHQGSSGGRSGGNTGPWADVPKSGERWVDTKNGKRRYEFGLDDAPDCLCERPAVKFSGKNAKGKLWSKWLCALGSTKAYKDKCTFDEWA